MTDEDELIQLTRNIYQAVLDKDEAFLKERVAERLQYKGKLFGERGFETIDREELFENHRSAVFIIHPEYRIYSVIKQDKAKITAETRLGISCHLTHFKNAFERFKLTRTKVAFKRHIYFYLKTDGKWRLVKLEASRNWFSKYDAGSSFRNLFGFIINEGIM